MMRVASLQYCESAASNSRRSPTWAKRRPRPTCAERVRSSHDRSVCDSSSLKYPRASVANARGCANLPTAACKSAGELSTRPGRASPSCAARVERSARRDSSPKSERAPECMACRSRRSPVADTRSKRSGSCPAGMPRSRRARPKSGCFAASGTFASSRSVSTKPSSALARRRS